MMSKNAIRRGALCAACLIMVAAPAAAALGQESEQEIVVTGRLSADVERRVVPIGDLNLATEEGAQAMENRVDEAVSSICQIPAGKVRLEEQALNARCREEALSSARPQMEAALQRARAGSPS